MLDVFFYLTFFRSIFFHEKFIQSFQIVSKVHALIVFCCCCGIHNFGFLFSVSINSIDCIDYIDSIEFIEFIEYIDLIDPTDSIVLNANLNRSKGVFDHTNVSQSASVKSYIDVS